MGLPEELRVTLRGRHSAQALMTGDSPFSQEIKTKARSQLLRAVLRGMPFFSA